MKKQQKGFTLIEVMIAMMIMASGIILLTQSWSGSFLRIKKTQLSNEVAALLERKMTEVDIKYRGKPIESIPEDEGDDFGSDYPQYRWQMTSKEFQMPDLSASLTSKEGGADEMMLMIMKQLTDHLSKTVKEVKVSIFYKASKKELEFSAVTYFVDYNKEIPLPGVSGAATPPVGGN